MREDFEGTTFWADLGGIAQLVERLVRNEKVRGSTPLTSTRSVDRGHQIRPFERLLIGGGEYLIQMKDILLLCLIGFQRCKTLSLESPLDPEFVGWIPKFRQVDGHFARRGIEIASRNQITDVVSIPLLRELVVEKLNPERERVINANNGLARQKHASILAEDPMRVKSSGANALSCSKSLDAI